MEIDNLVTVDRRSTAEFPAQWRVVGLTRAIRGLFRNDEVGYLRERWLVYDIRDGGKTLVIRPKP